MKKLFISLVALVAVLASCSKSDVVSVPFENIPISFNPYNGRTPEVKSTTFDSDSMETFKFNVKAFLNANATPYMNKDVARNKENTAWVYDGVSYWPGTLPLQFVAYGLNTDFAGNDDDNNIVVLNTETNRSITVNVPDVIKKQRDLLVAGGQTGVQYTEANNGVVSLNFKHMFARIQFSLKTKSGNSVPVTMEDIAIKGNFASIGTVDLTAAEPQIVAGEAAEKTYDYLPATETFTGIGSVDGQAIYDNSPVYEFDDKETETSSDDEYVTKSNADEAAATWNEKNHYMMIIPTSSHNAKLNVKYFLPFAGSFNADSNAATADVDPVDLSGINFEAGKSYNFVLEVSTNSIEFSVEITDWVDGVISQDKQVIKLN